MKKIQPKKIQKVNCKKCGELLLKLYPWHNFAIKPDAKFSDSPCNKCKNSTLKS